jgi:hypothetical protein
LLLLSDFVLIFRLIEFDKDGDTVHFDGIGECLNFKLKTLPDPIPFEGVRSPASEAQPFQPPFFLFSKKLFRQLKKNIYNLIILHSRQNRFLDFEWDHPFGLSPFPIN